MVQNPGGSRAVEAPGEWVVATDAEAAVLPGFPLATFARVPATLIFYESGPRLADSLAAMADVFGPRPAAVARELTKRFEETVRGDLPDLAARYAESGAPKGEIVVLVAPPSEAEAEWNDARIDTALKEAMEADSVKDAAAAVAKASGLPRRDLYQRALALKSRA